MNWLQKQIANIAIKAITDKQVTQALFQWLNKGQPVYMNDVADNYIKQGYSYNSDLYAIINYVITTANTINFKVEMPDGKIVEEHPKLELLYNPNPLASKSQFIEAWLGYKMLVGNSYIWRNRLTTGANAGKIKEIWTLPAQHIEILFGDASNPVQGYRLRQIGYDHEFKADQIMHSRYWNPEYEWGQGLYGMSPLKSALRLLTKSNAAVDSETAAFQNQGPPAIVSSKTDGTLGEEDAQNMKSRLTRRHTGPANFNKVLFTGASVDVHQLGLSPVDLNILESNKITFRQLCRIFKFPAGLLDDDSNRTYNNVNEDKKRLYEDVLIPELETFCSDFDHWTKDIYGDGSKLIVDTSDIEVLQENKKEQTEWLTQAWWISADRKQEIMGENVDANFKGKYFMPMGLIEYGKAPTDQITDEDLDKALKNIY